MNLCSFSCATDQFWWDRPLRAKPILFRIISTSSSAIFRVSRQSRPGQTCPSRSRVDHVLTSNSETSAIFSAFFSVTVQSPWWDLMQNPLSIQMAVAAVAATIHGQYQPRPTVTATIHGQYQPRLCSGSNNTWSISTSTYSGSYNTWSITTSTLQWQLQYMVNINLDFAVAATIHGQYKPRPTVAATIHGQYQPRLCNGSYNTWSISTSTYSGSYYFSKIAANGLKIAANRLKIVGRPSCPWEYSPNPL